MERRAFLAAAGGACTALAGCAGDGSDGENGSNGGGAGEATRGATVTFDVPAIDSNRLQPRVTCDGENVSPHVIVIELASVVESLALVMDDPDARGEPFVHWTLWDLPPTASDVPADVPNEPRPTLEGAVSEGEPPTVSQGTNDEGSIGYYGPCPPEGEEHTYRFRLYGLSEPLGVDAGADPERVRDALTGKVVGDTAYTGQYRRGDGG